MIKWLVGDSIDFEEWVVLDIFSCILLGNEAVLLKKVIVEF